jgi:hypothetical protein
MRLSLSYEENMIVSFLKAYPRMAFSGIEIAKKAGGRKLFDENPRWAAQLLPKLREADILDVDSDGKYHFVTDEERAEREKKARKRMDMGR